MLLSGENGAYLLQNFVLVQAKSENRTIFGTVSPTEVSGFVQIKQRDALEHILSFHLLKKSTQSVKN